MPKKSVPPKSANRRNGAGSFDAVRQLQTHKLRPTLARIGILSLLAEAHPESWSAEKIFQYALQGGLKGSVATIYRALRDLVDHKLLFKDLNADGAATYRLKPHDYDEHSITISCGEPGNNISIVDHDLRGHVLDVLIRKNLIKTKDEIQGIQINIT